MIDKLKVLNRKYLDIYNDDIKKIKKFEIIEKILESKNSFLNMKIEYAYAILRDLGFKEVELKNIYLNILDELKSKYDE